MTAAEFAARRTAFKAALARTAGVEPAQVFITRVAEVSRTAARRLLATFVQVDAEIHAAEPPTPLATASLANITAAATPEALAQELASGGLPDVVITQVVARTPPPADNFMRSVFAGGRGVPAPVVAFIAVNAAILVLGLCVCCHPTWLHAVDNFLENYLTCRPLFQVQ